MEVNLSNKPIIFVETYDNIMRMIASKQTSFDKTYYKYQMGWNDYSFSKKVYKFVKKSGLLNKYNTWIKTNSQFNVGYKFFGKIIKIEDLSYSLKNIENIKIKEDMKKKFGLNEEPNKYISKIILTEIEKNYIIKNSSYIFI